MLNLSGWRERGFYGRAYRVKQDIGADDLIARLQKTLDHEVEVLEHQFSRNGVEAAEGEARFVGPHQIEVTGAPAATMWSPRRLHPDRLRHASVSARLYSVRRHVGVRLRRDFDLTHLPRSLTVIGAGVIGVEYATIFCALDVAVTLIEPRPTFLDFVDREMIDEFMHELRDRNVALRLGAEVTVIQSAPGDATANWPAAGRP